MSRRSFFNNSFFHRLVGARGSASSLPPVPEGVSHDYHHGQQQAGSEVQENQTTATRRRPPDIFMANKPSNWGQIFQANSAASEIAQHRVVFLGEIHSRPPIISFQRAVQEEMSRCAPGANVSDSLSSSEQEGKPTLHVVFEHFSFEMQSLLDAYLDERITFDELVQEYKNIGTESHDLEPYRALLEDAKQLNKVADNERLRRVQLHAGFLSRKYARLLMKEGQDACFQSAAAQWLPPNPTLLGTTLHYRIFESLLTGRSLVASNNNDATPPDDRFRSIFQAQLLKDVAMANKINNIIDSATQQDKVLVLVGNGHVLGYSGVPERVLQAHPELAKETCVVVSHHGTDLPVVRGDESSLIKSSILHHLSNTWGPSNLADYIYVYGEPEIGRSTRVLKGTIDAAHEVKEETKTAYDKVGESAHIPGNAAKARAIMRAMRYSDKQISIAGQDVHNYQGVGNPHLHADIQPGETVLDVGSGLGIDSFIAHAAATEQGFVVGIDISNTEVKHAQLCAERRKLSQRIRFCTADMEQIPLPDNCVDVVISNGAFCLAPDKEKAFREIYRVLKPGGRISICTTTTIQDKSQLEEADGVAWPVCMKMFVPKNEILPMCQRIGYSNVLVDDSDSSMSMELPVEVLVEEEAEENSNPNSPQRSKVHVGSAEFSHLKDYDMDKLCARVCVVARKPLSDSSQ